MIAVTGASGKLGQHVIAGLVKRISPGEVIAVVRDKAKAANLAAIGVHVREANYHDGASLRAAFAGAATVLLISSSEIEGRMAQHESVIAAAKAAGVSRLAYTSLLNAEASDLLLAADHKATETMIAQSGLSYTILRNGWYLENHTEQLAPALQHGAILGAAGDGRFSSAARKDYADAAVAALVQPPDGNVIHELAGDASYTLQELAAEISAQSGKTVAYVNLPEQEFAKTLEGFGLPPVLAQILADADAGAARGELESRTPTLRELIGRPTTALSEAVAAALKS